MVIGQTGQLTEGGWLVAPLALAPGLAFVVRGTVSAGAFGGRLTRPAYFMPLRGDIAIAAGGEKNQRERVCDAQVYSGLLQGAAGNQNEARRFLELFKFHAVNSGSGSSGAIFAEIRCARYFRAAPTNDRNSGCGSRGFDLNSG